MTLALAAPMLRAPFPWFGGKSRAAELIWRAMGNVPNYVEPFAGSLAVLLARPHEAKIETVNDRDCYLSNFWRAIAADPDAVAEHADWPVNEADLHARHRWLVEQSGFRDKMRTDPDYYDAKIAGWWVWGLSMWIGGGWCEDTEIEYRRPQVAFSSAGQGVHKKGALHQKRPDLYVRGHGRGIRAARPEDGDDAPSVRRDRGSVAWNARPDLGGLGQGVHLPEKRIRAKNCGVSKEQMPGLGSGGMGIAAPSRMPDLGGQGIANGTREGRWSIGAPMTEDGPPCLEWFRMLRHRLRRVRVCCGDFARVLTDSVIGTTDSRNSGMNPCGILLDPPYSKGERAMGLYGVDDGEVAQRVAEWAREHGGDPDLRIVLCGYEGEHVMPGWTEVEWKALRGYSGKDNKNRHRERLWLSPHCLPLEDVQRSLFGSGR